MTYRILFICSILTLFVSCKDTQNKNEIQSDNKDSEVENSTDTKQPTAAVSKNFELIQGEWQNVNDTLSTLIFKDNTTKNYYDGIDSGNNIEFVISNTCLNGSNPEGSEEEDVYISTAGDANECYYILQLDSENLVMSFLGRGNTLAFKRVVSE